MKDTEKEAVSYIALNTLPSIGPGNFKNLVERFGTASAVFNAPVESLMEVKGIGPKTAGQIVNLKAEETAASEKDTAAKEGFEIITSLSPKYPTNMKLAFAPPPVLYVAGEIVDTDNISVAVVGTRNLSPYGRIATEQITSGLVSMGVTIVSGFARGVDTFAHTTAVENGGRTIAILGSGLDRIYPPENGKLFPKVRDNGAVVSQFPFGTEPDKRNFPIRNRILSSMTLGTVVIEAGEKSGALITAYAALEEGREVFAVPGRIDSSKSVGSNRLIQKGAKLVMSAEEIAEEFLPEIRDCLVNISGVAKDKKESGEFEDVILESLDGAELHVDDLIDRTGLPSGILLGLLLEMELKGLIKQLPGKIYCKGQG